jgi:hypothetical protein
VLLSTALFYLGSRAKITSWLWSQYPPGLARFMDCSACTGFWWGLLLSAQLDLTVSLTSLPMPFGLVGPFAPFMVGLVSLVLTPIVAGWMQRGLENVGTATE